MGDQSFSFVLPIGGSSSARKVDRWAGERHFPWPLSGLIWRRSDGLSSRHPGSPRALGRLCAGRISKSSERSSLRGWLGGHLLHCADWRSPSRKSLLAGRPLVYRIPLNQDGRAAINRRARRQVSLPALSEPANINRLASPLRGLQRGSRAVNKQY